MNKSSHLLITIIVLAFAVYGIIDVLTTRGSSLGRIFTYLTVFMFLLSFSKPLSGLYMLLPVSCTLDLMKRLMIVFGHPTEMQLAVLMAMPILIVAGATLGVAMSGVFGSRRLSRTNWRVFIFCAIIGLLTVVGMLAAGSDGFGLRSIGHALNQATYTFLIFLVPILLDTVEKRRKYLYYSIILLIFVALYMLKHSYFGLAKFEEDYLWSGLTQEVRIFFHDGDARRYFSTLSSAAVVCMLLSVNATMALFLIKKEGKSKTAHGVFIAITIAILLYFASALTLTKTGLICGFASLIAYFSFGGYLRTKLLYVVAISVFLIACFTSKYIIKHDLLREWQGFISEEVVSSEGASVDRALNLTTMYDRLNGWEKISRPWIFPLFGTIFGGEVVDDEGDINLAFSHDFIVTWLARLGWVPFIVVMIMVTILMRQIHKYQFSIDTKSVEFKIVRVSLACAAGLSLGAVANAAQFAVFPVNFFFYLWIGMAVGTLIKARESRFIEA